jgi:hypothetical protein
MGQKRAARSADPPYMSRAHAAPMRVLLLLLPLGALALAEEAPTGLLCDFQRAPALGVRNSPRFTWIVPPCTSSPDQTQSAYRIVVVTANNGTVVWESGKVASADSTYVAYAGPALASASRYMWTVTTWTQSCQSAASAAALFVTAPWDGFSPAAQYISTSNKSATFGYFRKEVAVPAHTIGVVGFVSARVNDFLLSGYKLFIDDALINIGPGRGEAPVWGGDGVFRSLPVQTLDLTAVLTAGGSHVLALQTMHQNGPSVMLEVRMTCADGATITLVTDSSWLAFNGDVHRNPAPATQGGSAGTAFLEYIDARHEPVGWRMPGFAPGSGWLAAVGSSPSSDDARNLHPRMQPPMQTSDLSLVSIVPVPSPAPKGVPVRCGYAGEQDTLLLGCGDGSAIEGVEFASFGTPSGTCPHLAKSSCDANTTLPILLAACVGKATCSVLADDAVFGDPCLGTIKQLAAQIKCNSTAPPSPPPLSRSFLADFGREFQGGLRLAVADGVAGTTVSIACGEALQAQHATYTWGWEFTWTLREGEQYLEQHKYMECRFVTITFSSAASPRFSLTAWRASYPWAEDDSNFVSSDATLNAVRLPCDGVHAHSHMALAASCLAAQL